MDFEYIVLTDSQYDLLCAVNETDIYIDKGNDADCQYLFEIRFVDIFTPSNQSFAPMDKIGVVAKGITITTLGKQYLAWRKAQDDIEKAKSLVERKKSRRSRLFDIGLVLLGAIATLVVEFLLSLVK